MSEEEILKNIQQLKSRVKEIVITIQNLKKQLEQGAIPLDEFKSNKLTLENELREILQQIAEVKEKTIIKPRERVVKEPAPVKKTPPIKKEEPPPIEIIKEAPPVEKEVIEVKEETSQLIDKEVLIASEAKDLMYYFQTEFIDSITNALVYLSITLDEHFIIGLDFEAYPEKPKLNIPLEIIKLFEGDIDKFWEKTISYSNWDSANPKRIYELIIEIESILIEIFHADVKTIEKQSVERIQKSKKLIQDLLKEAQDELDKKNFQKAINKYSRIIDICFFIGDNEGVKIYTDRLNEILILKRDSEKSQI
ncbi:MAG: hypothetical protein EU529_16335 [Promethearchaeota archaeon]|nr:MAG: hypothetical protein EU529_16335 [Candidatus Lokiarchaeota archaeon]